MGFLIHSARHCARMEDSARTDWFPSSGNWDSRLVENICSSWASTLGETTCIRSDGYWRTVVCRWGVCRIYAGETLGRREMDATASSVGCVRGTLENGAGRFGHYAGG